MLGAGKWSWDYIRGTPPITRDTCAAFLRSICESGTWKDVPWMHSPTLANPHVQHPTPLFGGADMAQQTATLLLGRGPFAWLGYNFAGRMPQDNMAAWPAVLDADVGVPTGNCSEPLVGVFERRFSRGMARLDCNNYTASIPGFDAV